MKKILCGLALLAILAAGCRESGAGNQLGLLKEMFSEMVVKKQASLIPHYYHPEFLLFTNGREMGYEEFLNSHREVYETPIQYAIDYDTETFVEQGDKIAGRVFITTSLPTETPKEIEVILVVQYKDNKIYRVWELTYPDWSKLDAFENFNKD